MPPRPLARRAGNTDTVRSSGRAPLPAHPHAPREPCNLYTVGLEVNSRKRTWAIRTVEVSRYRRARTTLLRTICLEAHLGTAPAARRKGNRC